MSADVDATAVGQPAGDWVAAGQELRRGVYGGGKVLPGSIARRDVELRASRHR